MKERGDYRKETVLTGETAGPWNHERATTYGGIYSFGS